MNVQIKSTQKIDPAHPTGLEPAPKTTDTHPFVDTQLKKPLIPENRVHANDLMNVQIDPAHPTGLEPAPKTTDTHPFVDT